MCFEYVTELFDSGQGTKVRSCAWRGQAYFYRSEGCRAEALAKAGDTIPNEFRFSDVPMEMAHSCPPAYGITVSVPVMSSRSQCGPQR